MKIAVNSSRKGEVDPNGSGATEAGEPGQSGITVNLVGPGGLRLTTLTSSDGHFRFMALADGVYTVSQQLPAGFVALRTVQAVTVSQGRSELVRFANQVNGVISGKLFYDQYLDQTLDRGEPGMGGLTVEILQVASGNKTTIVTRADYAGHLQSARRCA